MIYTMRLICAFTFLAVGAEAMAMSPLADYGYDCARDVSRCKRAALSTIPSSMAGMKIAFRQRDGGESAKALGIGFGGPNAVQLIGTFAINNFAGLGGGLARIYRVGSAFAGLGIDQQGTLFFLGGSSPKHMAVLATFGLDNWPVAIAVESEKLTIIPSAGPWPIDAEAGGAFQIEGLGFNSAAPMGARVTIEYLAVSQ